MIQKILSNEDLPKAFNLPDNDLSNEIFERIRNSAMNVNAAKSLYINLFRLVYI